MKRISKRAREQAVLVLAVSASNPGLLTLFAASSLGIKWTSMAGYLARRARGHVEMYGSHGLYTERCAEAESLLRTGWTP